MGRILAEALFVAEFLHTVVVDLAFDQGEENSRCFGGSEGSVDELELLFVFHVIGIQGLQNGQCWADAAVRPSARG